MSVRYRSNVIPLKSAQARHASTALRRIADAIVEQSTPKTPKDTGFLRQKVLKQVLGPRGRLIWLQHYAAIQESKQFANYTTAGTGPHFAENAVKRVARNASQYFRRERLL